MAPLPLRAAGLGAVRESEPDVVCSRGPTRVVPLFYRKLNRGCLRCTLDLAQARRARARRASPGHDAARNARLWTRSEGAAASRRVSVRRACALSHDTS